MYERHNASRIFSEEYIILETRFPFSVLSKIDPKQEIERMCSMAACQLQAKKAMHFDYHYEKSIY